MKPTTPAQQSSLHDQPSSEEAATWAYRLILGREPENVAAVRDHARSSESIADLRERFLQSSEFTQRYRAVEHEQGRNVSVFPPCHIEVAVDAETRTKLLDHVARSWDHMGETEPYWSVMFQPEYLMDRIGGTRAAFLDSGRENVERLLATLRRNDIAPNPRWQVLELGCGLGRSTRWLAPLFSKVLAMDVSASHLQIAKEINGDAPHVERIEWLQLRDPGGLDTMPEFDLFFSMIVLQHNPPPVIGMFLEKIAAKLRPGGFAFFQVPTYQRDYFFDAENYLKLRAETRDIEMHAFPQSEIFRIFRDNNCIPLEVFEDGLSGHRDNHRSNSFLFRKRDEGRDRDWTPTGAVGYAKSLQAEIERINAEAAREHNAAEDALKDAARYAASLEVEREALKRRIEVLEERTQSMQDGRHGN